MPVARMNTIPKKKKKKKTFMDSVNSTVDSANDTWEGVKDWLGESKGTVFHKDLKEVKKHFKSSKKTRDYK